MSILLLMGCEETDTGGGGFESSGSAGHTGGQAWGPGAGLTVADPGVGGADRGFAHTGGLATAASPATGATPGTASSGPLNTGASSMVGPAPSGVATAGADGGGASGGRLSDGGTRSDSTVFAGGATAGGHSGGGFRSDGGGGLLTGGAGASDDSGGSPGTGGKSEGGIGGQSGGDTGAGAAGGSGGGRNAGGVSSSGGSGEPAGGGAAAGGASTRDDETGGAASIEDVTIYLAGDSTVLEYADTASTTDQAGWGQMLHEIFTDQATIVNRASGGRTALWFYLEGAVGKILSEIQPGDYFFVQFGTNDSNTTATFEVDGATYQRYADPDTDFKMYLKDYYIEPTREMGAIPVLVTPPPRNSAYCGGGNSLGAHAQAMRELGEAEAVSVLDLNDKTFAYLSSICPSPTPEDFFAFKSDGSVDGTHFQENGARIMAGFLAECIVEAGLGLRGALLR